MGEKNILITGFNNNFSIIAQNFNCKDFIQYLIKEKSTLKGGGNQIKGNFKGDIEEKELKKLLVEYIER